VKKRNVTIALDEDLAKWARVRAAQCDKSLSQFLAETLEKDMEAEMEAQRERARRGLERFLSIGPWPLSKPGDRYPTREELYDRPGLR
jgi:hypothetical protein